MKGFAMGVRRIDVQCVEIEDKPGSLQRFLTQSSLSGVDFSYFAGYSCGNNHERVFVSAKDAGKFRAFAKEAELRFSDAVGFVVSGEDRLGAGAEALKALAEGDVHGIAGSGMVWDRMYQLVIVVSSEDAEKAEALLSV
jgi:hypothetical protein